MNKTLFPVLFVLALGATPARAQVSLHIELGLPVAPPLVVVAPGIQVVEGFGEEVFFSRGWYWCRRPDGWYRARSPRARFGWVEGRYVPGGLMRIPPGQYRNWHHEEHREMGRREEHREMGRREEHRERREEHRERQEAHRERQEAHRERQEERHHEH